MSGFTKHMVLAIKSAYRNFKKNFLYGCINVIGLSIAFATLILVITYLYQEKNYESFHENAERIFRPTYHYKSQSDFEIHFARIPVNFINLLPEEFPEIEYLIRFQNKEQKYIRIGDKKFKPKDLYITDPEVFTVFSLPMIAGDPKTALINPNSIVITESVAQKYFPNENAMGQEVIISGDWSAEEKVFKVTGIMKDLPVNTHLPIQFLLSFTNPEERNGWAYIYTMLAKGSDIAGVESRMSDFVAKHSNSENPSEITFDFQPLKDIHLNSHLAREIKPNGELIYIRIFFWVGLFVWIIALINFTNLSAALSLSRGNEIGVRKFLGATQNNIVLFALTESLIYCFVALGMGVLCTFFFFPIFQRFTGVEMIPPLKYLIPLLLTLTLISGIVGGLLPAIILNSRSILQNFKEGNQWSFQRSTGVVNLKRTMISIQFGAAIMLIGSAFIGHLQFSYINKTNLEIVPEQIVAIPAVPDLVTRQYTVLKNRLLNLPGVKGVSSCMQIPSTEIRDVGPVLVKGVNEEVSSAPMMDVQIVDQDFISMMEIELLAGKDFTAQTILQEVPEFDKDLTPSKYLASVPRKYLINETAMKQLGWNSPDQALGQEINWSIGSFVLAFGPITGIIKDYHQESLKNKVDPLVILVEPLWLQNILIKVEAANLTHILSEIEDTWNDLFPYAIEYHFLDELFHKLYNQDRIQLKLLSTLACLAIFISFMGVIGLVAYALRTRSKELSIRRVIGADLGSLVVLIGKEYIWVLALSALVGIPLSYIWVTKWLQNFAYHVEVSLWIYLISILLIYLFLFAIIYLQTFKATIDNPVRNLREE